MSVQAFEQAEQSLELRQLRFNLRETSGDCDCGCAAFTEEELLALLEKHSGDVNAASYEGLLIKAQCGELSLPDGFKLPDGRNYWLSLARLYRPCCNSNLARSDEVDGDGS